jgi:hypothetical protein
MSFIDSGSTKCIPFTPITDINKNSSEFVIENVSPASSPSFSSDSFSPKHSDQYTITDSSSQSEQGDKTDKKIIEFSSEWFDQSSKVWRRGKIFSRKKQMFYYKTNTDSPFTMEDYKNTSSRSSSSSRKTKNGCQINANIWSQCGYISSSGIKCIEQGIFYGDEIASNKEYDFEKYTDVHFCKLHTKFQKKEERKRQLQIECILLERQIRQNHN